MTLSTTDFEFIRGLAYADAAIVLEPGKEYLVETRLTPLAKDLGHTSLGAFIGALRLNPALQPARGRVVDALTTNETCFFRDLHPFEALRKVILPALVKDRGSSVKLSIWSAAASTGQEAYSVAMLIREHFPASAAWDLMIHGTDISPTVIQRAREGVYNQVEVNRGLPAGLLAKYFRPHGDKWVVNEELRRMVRFEQMNLVKPWGPLPRFEIILLRNVMIYFDVATKQRILRQLRTVLAPGGYLFLGGAETTMAIDEGFAPVTVANATVYQLATQTR